MMIAADGHSPLDLRIRLFGFPIRVAVFFWLIAALFGQGVLDRFGLPYLALWVGCFFVSVLLHELGHAFVFRWFGSSAQIVLHGLGGYAQGYPLQRAWQQLLMYAAGPFAGFLLAGVLFASTYITDWPATSLAAYLAYVFLLILNVFWGVINLLPILPMDGGNILREFLTILGVRRSQLIALWVSVILGVLLCAWGVTAALGIKLPVITDVLPQEFTPPIFLSVWLGLMTVMNFQQLSELNKQGRFNRRVTYYAGDDTPPWRQR
jgi:Zn-dependent protease